MCTAIGFSLLIGCENEDEDTPDVPSQRVIFTSEQDLGNTINVNEDLTFGDASTGVESRTWTFPEGIVDIENSSNNVTSNEAVVKAFFNAVGEYEVSLNQVFKSDALSDGQSMGRELDTTITVRVIPPVQATVTANIVDREGNLGAALDISNGAANEVTAGSTVRYFVSTVGEPNQFNWALEGGSPELSTQFGEFLDVQYRRLGTYDFNLIAGRNRPLGNFEISLSNLITVVPSTEPVFLERVVATEEGNISLDFSREIDPASLNVEDFIINITNGGNEVANTIASVTLNPQQGNVVILTLDGDRVYNDDTAVVSYTPGSLQTTDLVASEAFSDVQVIFVGGENLLDNGNYDFSFENTDESNWPSGGWDPPFNSFSFSISQNQAFDGDYSGLVEMNGNGGMLINHTDASGNQITFNAEAGVTYELGVWVFLETVGVPDGGDFFLPDVRFYWFPDVNWGVGPNPDFGEDFPLNEWVYSSIIIEFTESGDKTFSIRGYNADSSAPTRFYMDNITVSEAVLRP